MGEFAVPFAMTVYMCPTRLHGDKTIIFRTCWFFLWCFISWQAIVIMLEDGHERVMTLIKNLFKFFSQTNIVKPDQIKNVSIVFTLELYLVYLTVSLLKASAKRWEAKKKYNILTHQFISTGIWTSVWLICRYSAGYSQCTHHPGEIHWHVCLRRNYSNLFYSESAIQVLNYF